MKKINIRLAVSTLIAVFTIGVAGVALNAPTVSAAQATVDLKTATPFAILAGTPAITDAGNASVITGNVGMSPRASSYIGLLCTQLTGTIYAIDDTGNPCFTVNAPLVVTAKNDLDTAYTDAANRIPVITVNTELGGQHLYSGVYTTASTALQITGGADGPGPLVLDAQNDASAVFIFEGSDAEAGALTVGPGGTVSLINGASACNVFWRVYGATIGTSAVFKGNILALTSITVADGANIEGRLLARNGQVTLINDIITVPTCTIPVVVTPAVTPTVIPKLPNTGFISNSSNLIAISVSAAIATIALVSIAIVIKKRAI